MPYQLHHNIARIRRDIRMLSDKMQSEIDADRDCTETARALMRAQQDLRLYIERMEHVKTPPAAAC